MQIASFIYISYIGHSKRYNIIRLKNFVGLHSFIVAVSVSFLIVQDSKTFQAQRKYFRIFVDFD